MLDTRPHLASYFLFPVDEGGSPWPIEDGEPPTLHLLGDGVNGTPQERLIRLIADRDEPVDKTLDYVGSVSATYDVLEVTYPGGIGSRRIIRRSSGADLADVFGAESWFNIDGDGWIHDENITGPDRDEWELTDFGEAPQPTSYQVQFYVRTLESVPIAGTWAEVLGMTLSDVDLPVEKHYDNGTVEADGTIPGRRAVIAGSAWTHSDSRVAPIDRAGIQNLLTSFGEMPPSPWGNVVTDPEDPCYEPDPELPHWPTAFGSPARYYGPTGVTNWKLVFTAGLQSFRFTAGVGILETNGVSMDGFIASLNAGLVDEITGCPVQVDGGDPIFNDTPNYSGPEMVLSLYGESSPWGSTGGDFPPDECPPQALPVPGVALTSGYTVDVGDLVFAFHALAADDGGFHDFRETGGNGTAADTVAAYLAGGLIYDGPLGQLPRPLSGQTATFCGRPVTAAAPYSLDVLALDAGVRVVLIQDDTVTVWDYQDDEVTPRWSNTLANSLPPDLYDFMDLSDPVQGYRFVTPGWPHRTGVVTVGGVNILVEVADRLRDVRYRVPGGKPPLTFAYGWA